MSQKSYLDRKKYKVKEVIQNYLSLEKRGRNFWAICPFHDDTRASLSVSEEKNIFKCFSCGVTGDAISFVMKKENIPFNEAVFKAHTLLKFPIEQLSSIKFNSKDYLFKQQLIKFNNFVSEFFINSLNSEEGGEALQYLKEERKLSDFLIQKFKIGFSPAGEKLMNSIEQIRKISEEFKFISDEFLLKTGIFSKSSGTSEKIFPIFQNRIVFPIFSQNQEIIGFTSRRLGNSNLSEAKYIHSRETLLFKKANLLYNLPEINRVSEDSFIYLFEGIFDLLSFQLISPESICFALLGSEMSDNGFRLLTKLPSKKLVIIMDNDQAGRNAALKLFQKMLKYELNSHILPIDYGNNKDLSELYCSGSLIQLPKPVDYIEWIQGNWRDLWKKEEKYITDIISVNQIVHFLLDGLFQRDQRTQKIFLFSDIKYDFAFLQLSRIFSLYDSIEKTQFESEIIERAKQKYIEAINVKAILPQEDSIEIEIASLRRELSTPKDLTGEFSKIVEIIQKLRESNRDLQLISQKLSDWETPFLFQYFENYQLGFSEKEIPFFLELKEVIANFRSDLIVQKTKYLSLQEGEEIEVSSMKDFFELYYSLTEKTIRKALAFIKTWSTPEFPEKKQIIEQIDQDLKDVKQKYASLICRELEELKYLT
ncbi:CHC2 zinc finger domain-containing protein [Mycoplasma suis]|uniref:DNA primase n=2 Tax=Mycoplasma suis TaxID=57372 RepID=F0QS43_MYCSL|nr:CHC2 zinc finger domain-containing protein [Mycoplasma suis]ADX98313.1 DNA primase [Mycoplasma suis str. Illinois]CBZ40828.1 DNA primase [Mycoplasma suis KI3806]